MTEPGTLPEGPLEKTHAILHEFTGRPCRTDGGWCDARDHAEAIIAAVGDQLRAEGAAQERARLGANIRKRWDGHEALLILDMLEATRTAPPPEAQE